MEITLNPKANKPNGESDQGVAVVPCGYVIFGASGDLTRRKLLPAVFSLFRTKKVSDNFFIVGFARSIMDDNAFRLKVKESLQLAYGDLPAAEIENFVKRCFYVAGSYDQDDGYLQLKKETTKLAVAFGTCGNLVFHVATPPSLYATIVAHLGKNDLVERAQDATPFQRVIVEKPFGQDLESAVRLHKELMVHLADGQLYRIDHYMGKETVQNILMFRFANRFFEPSWNSHHIDHIQITVAEEVGVGSRAGYFDQSGLLRDMFQNHMLQLLALVGMEPPVDFSADGVRDERIKFMKSIRPFDLENLDNQLLRGQYSGGEVSGQKRMAYREADGVPSTSCTETYFAMKLLVDNWRWKGVPFYLQAGKSLEKKLTRIAVVFKKVPICISSDSPGKLPAPNVLIFEIQPKQGASLLFQAKVPGTKKHLAPLRMELDYHEAFGAKMDEDYSTLIMDCILGDQTLYWRKDGVKASWNLLTPVLEKWESASQAEKESLLAKYTAGSWGPAEGNRLIEQDGRAWIIS